MKHLKTLPHPSHLFAKNGGILPKYVYWAPIILGFFPILFLGVFALDAFIPKRSWSENLFGFFMHLIPNFVLILLLLLAWKHQRLGGFLYIILGIFFFLFFKNPWMINFMLFGPILLTGGLFLFSAFYTKNLKE